MLYSYLPLSQICRNVSVESDWYDLLDDVEANDKSNDARSSNDAGKINNGSYKQVFNNLKLIKNCFDIKDWKDKK